MNNIYFIGMPGCGKSTISQLVSKEMKILCVDTDEFIENKLSKTISEIFSSDGEEVFRKFESCALKKISKMENIIVSTGGGIVEMHCNKQIMKSTGIVIFIDTPLDDIIKNSSLLNRPLLDDKNKIYSIYDRRIEKYKNFSDYTVLNNGSLSETVNQIKNIIYMRKISERTDKNG